MVVVSCRCEGQRTASWLLEVGAGLGAVLGAVLGAGLGLGVGGSFAEVARTSVKTQRGATSVPPQNSLPVMLTRSLSLVGLAVLLEPPAKGRARRNRSRGPVPTRNGGRWRFAGAPACDIVCRSGWETMPRSLLSSNGSCCCPPPPVLIVSIHPSCKIPL